MKFLNKIKSKFIKRKCEDCGCKLSNKPFTINVLGTDIGILEATRCPECSEKYLSETSPT